MNNEKIRTIIKKEIKKILSENNNHENIWYHTTKKENVDNILKNGLLINQRPNFSKASLTWVKDAYDGVIPIYLSKDPGKYIDGIILKIDTSGLKLLPDLPSLIDKGAGLNEESIWFAEHNTPYFLYNYEDSEATFEDYLSDSVLINGSIELTGTAAVTRNIPAENISIYNG
jgi:hypothetical protein